MRSHAKAAFAGSTQRRATGPAAFICGARSRSPRRKIALSLAVFSLTLVLGVSGAFASKELVDFIGGPSGSGSKGGEFNVPREVATNTSGVGAAVGDIYVVDQNNHRIQRFDRDGDFVWAIGRDVIATTATTNTDLGDVFEKCTVAADCKAGSFGTTGPAGDGPAGELDSPQSIAIDQATGHFYVSDRLNFRIQQFDANGNFIRTWGFDVIAAGKPNDNGTGFEVCDVSNGNAIADCKKGVAGSGVGQVGEAIALPALGLAIRPLEGSPASRKLFLADGKNRRVNTYDLNGANPSSFGSSSQFGTGTGAGAEQPKKIAVDSRGIVYASDSTASGEVDRYDSENANGGGVGFLAPILATNSVDATAPDDGPLLQGSNTAGAAAFSTTGGLAADPDSDGPGPDEDVLYVLRDPSTGITVVQQIGPVNDPGLTAPPAAADDNGHAASANFGLVQGFGFDARSGRAFVSATTNNFGLGSGHRVYIFDDIEPPLAQMKPVTSFNATEATLEGEVDAKGSQTNYRFEYRQAAESSWTSVPVPDGDAGAGEGFAAVPPETVAGLEPNTKYEARLVAQKPNGPGHTSTPVSFTTPKDPPRIVRVGAFPDNSDTSAVLFATIDPQSSSSTYRFHWGTDASYGNATPVEFVGAGADEQVMVARITGLVPGTAYHFKAVATNVAGTSESGDATFTKAALPSCPNAALRRGPSAKLPDCRAYEMVSPIDKNGGDVADAVAMAGVGEARGSAYRQASLDGEKITYSSATAFAGAPGAHFSNQYLSTRGEDGWSTEPISSRRGRTLHEPFAPFGISPWELTEFFQGFTPDLSSAWVRDDNVDPLAPGALEGHVNLYRRDIDAGSYEPLTNQGPFGPTQVHLDSGNFQRGLKFIGASADLRHQVFTAAAALTADAFEAPDKSSNPNQIYDLVDGELHLVSILPDGSAATTNSFAGNTSTEEWVKGRDNSLKNAVSDDGSRIFWTTTNVGRGAGKLYVRENPAEEQSALDGGGSCTEPEKACTFSVSERISPNPAWFWGASADGSKVLFSLGDGPDSKDLYLFDVETKAAPILVASQAWGVSATSEDLSDVYLVSREDKDGPAGAAVAGDNNLYHYDASEDTYTLIAAVSDVDVEGVTQILPNGNTNAERSAGIVGRKVSGEPTPHATQTRATPDGGHFAFMSSSASLAEAVAGYDNTDLVTGKPDFEVYHYDAEADRLSCASCNPSGSRPRGVLLRFPYSPVDVPFDQFPDLRTAATIPTHEQDNYSSRLLSADGNRLFFHSEEALLPQDTNGVQDVYLWQAEGTGGCEVGSEAHFAANNGCLSLISSGRDGAKSEFVDADPTGEEVFISTDEGLDPRDPGLRDVYVAKVGGGFEIPVATAPCEGEACQTPPAPPAFDGPSSSSFTGPGDLPSKAGHRKPRCPKGKRRVKARNGKARCLKRNRKANHSRRASR